MNYDSKEYKRSRASYMTQCTVEYFVSLLVTDAFLAKLLTYVGISDSLIGIISSFISMAFVIQLLSVFIVRIKASTKKIVMIFDTISIFFFSICPHSFLLKVDNSNAIASFAILSHAICVNNFTTFTIVLNCVS